jgi:hypothetical protein
MNQIKEPAAAPSQILSELGVGVTIAAFSEQGCVKPLSYPPTGQVVLALDDGYGPSSVVTAYEFDGESSAKLTLTDESTSNPWTQGVTGGGLTDPIELGPPESAVGFLLEDTGGGALTMQTLGPPTLLALGWEPSPTQGGLWLCAGATKSAVFTFQITG